MTSKVRLISHLLPLFVIIMGACGCSHTNESAAIYSQVDIESWKPEAPVEFSSIEDSATIDINSIRAEEISLRYTRRSPEKISLVMMAESFSGPQLTDTLRLQLFNSKGQPVGRGIHGVYELSVPLPENISPKRLPEGWRLTLFPLQATSGITQVGLTMASIFERAK